MTRLKWNGEDSETIRLQSQLYWQKSTNDFILRKATNQLQCWGVRFGKFDFYDIDLEYKIFKDEQKGTEGLYS